MCVMLGYDFVTEEKLTVSFQRDSIVEGFARTKKNLRVRMSLTTLTRSDSDLHLQITTPPTPNSKRFRDNFLHFVNQTPPSASYRTDRRSSTPGRMSTANDTGGQLVQRCVIVTRDDSGYGLTVSGFNPVFVQSVKEDGSAARAGVRQGDRIIKVNGTSVRETNHMDVVKMISNSGPYVALTLYSESPSTSGQVSGSSGGGQTYPTVRHSFATRLHQQSTESIQTPSVEFRQKRAMTTSGDKLNAGDSGKDSSSEQLSDEEKQAEWKRKRAKIIYQMLEDEKKCLEDLIVESTRNPNAKNRQSLEAAQKRIANLETQLKDVKMATDDLFPPNNLTNGTVAAGTLPVSVPPASSSGQRSSFKSSSQKSGTVSVEESDAEQESSTLTAQTTSSRDVDGGPFSSFVELKGRLGHLAVFLHYLLSNSDPASLPLHVSTVDCSICQEIDNVLNDQNQCESEDVLKKLFAKARQKAWEEINELLSDFRSKRTLGLGNVFGENLLLGIACGDATRERKIADCLLTRHVESYFAGTIDYDLLQDRFQALASALTTVMKMFGIKPNNSIHEKLMDKCPLFVAKEKKGIAFIPKLGKQTVSIKSHQFSLNAIMCTSVCYQCQGVIWGISPQAYTCSECKNVIHKKCINSLEDACYASKQLRPSASRVMSPRPSSTEPGQKEEPKTAGTQPLPVPATNLSVDYGDKGQQDVESSKSVDSSKGKGNEWVTSKSAPTESICTMHTARTAPGNIARSRSMNKSDGHKRAGSDTASLTRNSEATKSPTIDVKRTVKKRTASASSSSSSISRSSLPDSPGALPLGPSPSDGLTEVTGGETMASSDSDLEVDNEIPRLDDVLPWDIVKLLKPKEKKRQEVINELFHTERTHVRNLKVLKKLFYEPLTTTQSKEFVRLLFANIEDVLNLHAKMNNAMKAVTKRNKLVGDIGDMMLAFFDGDAGKRFRKVAATFCHNQQYALEALKARRKKDQKLAQFLQEAECCAICRKLQLKDMLPMEMQRLTKYPLLLETVAKYTPEPSEELDKLRRCMECAKEILAEVNVAKRNSENTRRLQDLQKRLDTKEFDRMAHTIGKEYKNFDLRRYTLVHDGHLTWRLGKNKAVDLHVVLLEELMLLLTRNSDGQRLSLKFHNINLSTSKEDTKSTHCPLLKLNNLIAKNVATDNKAFFIVSTSAHGPQIYEFVTQTTSDKKKWFKLITDQIESCKQKEAPAPPATTDSTAVNLQPKAPEDAVVASPVVPSDPQVLKIKTPGVVEPTGSEEEQTTLTERAAVVNQPKLIYPSEVLVSQPTVLEHAEPILTPLETLKRKDELIFHCLAEKQKILSQIFNLPQMETDLQAVNYPTEIKGNKEARELALAAIVQTNRLLEAINEGMKAKQQMIARSPSTDSNVTTAPNEQQQQPTVSCVALTRIAAPLMKHLTALLHSLQMIEEDLKRVQLELRRCKSLAGSLKEAEEEKSKSESDLRKEISERCNRASQLTTDIDEYLHPKGSGTVACSSVPKLSVYSVSSEETLTESKVQTPMAKSPTSPPTSTTPGGGGDWIFVGKTTVTPALSTQNSLDPSKSLSLSSSSYKVSGGSSFSDPTVSSPEIVGGFVDDKAESVDSSKNGADDDANSADSGTNKDNGNDVDDKAQKRKQKRQRHAALTGLPNSRQASSDYDDNQNADRRNRPLSPLNK